MSSTELERLELMQRIAERRTTLRVVAEQLGLTLRQVERLYAGYKAKGVVNLAKVGLASCKSRTTLTADDDRRRSLRGSLPQVSR